MAVEKMVCLVDGEHYLPVTKSAIDTLNELEHIEVVAIIFIGGTEKLKTDDADLYSDMMGLPVHFGQDKSEIPYELITQIIQDYDASCVMDLSDEPNDWQFQTHFHDRICISSTKQNLDSKNRFL